MKHILSCFWAIFWVTVAQADHHSLQIDDCSSRSVAHWHGQAAYLLEPWNENSHYVEEHRVRLAILRNGDDDQPGYYLLILGQGPVSDSETEAPRPCRVVTFEGSTGFSKVDMNNLQVQIEQSRGAEILTFSLPVETITYDNQSQSKTLFIGLDPRLGSTWSHFEE